MNAMNTDEFKIMCGDAAKCMQTIDTASVDLVVTSPPYDTLRNYAGNGSMTMDGIANVIRALSRVVKSGGVVVWVVADKVIDGSESCTSFKTALEFVRQGFRLHDTMIWRKTNPMPRVRTKRYFDCFEYMFVFSKGQPKTFNPIMVDCKLGGKTYDSTCKNMGGESGRTRKTFKLNNKRYKDNIWDIAVAQNKTDHPAVFPLQIAEDHISSWSNEGDLVLDPFVGSGTTGIAAKKLNRRFIGIDISEKYCELATSRIMEFQRPEPIPEFTQLTLFKMEDY